MEEKSRVADQKAPGFAIAHIIDIATKVHGAQFLGAPPAIFWFRNDQAKDFEQR